MNIFYISIFFNIVGKKEMIRYEAALIIDGILKENKKRKLHFSLTNRRFYNGVYIDLEEESIYIKEDKLGYLSIPLFQILNIEPMRKR